MNAPVRLLAANLVVAAFALLTVPVAFSAELARPAANVPKPAHAAPANALNDLGKDLGRWLEWAADVSVDVLSRNDLQFLSGNKPKLFAENHATVLSGNQPKILSENTTPVLSGNHISIFSNIKVEIHLDQSGNTVPPPPKK